MKDDKKPINILTLRSCIYIDGKKYEMETYKEMRHCELNGASTKKIFWEMKMVIGDMCFEHESDWRKYYGMMNGKKPCVYCEDYDNPKKAGCRKWCQIWENWKKKKYQFAKETKK